MALLEMRKVFCDENFKEIAEGIPKGIVKRIFPEIIESFLKKKKKKQN